MLAELIQPLSPDDYRELARLLTKQGRYSQALQSLDAAMEVSATASIELVMDRATLLAKLGRFEEAAELYRQVFAHDRNHRVIRARLGDAAYADGNYPLAIFAYRESYLTDASLDSLAKLGLCAYDLGQDELAVHYVEQAIQASIKKYGDGFRIPGDWCFTRGRARWNLDQPLDAADDLLNAVNQDPGNPEKVRWAVYVCKEIKAPHGLIDVARDWGLHGDPNEAIGVLQYVRANWFFPVSRDHRGRRVARSRTSTTRTSCPSTLGSGLRMTLTRYSMA